jgi:hypothetical protein|tara:strand:- start:797 stop:1009 length:213 start_codon:yes stop_codon:yes gene_type:complete
MRELIIKALSKKYESQIAEAKAVITIYMEKPVGIGEHPQHLEEIDKQLSKIAEAEDKQKVLLNTFDEIPF